MAHGDIIASRYWNTNYTPVAIVAIEGGNNDVAAYIGGDPNSQATEEETLRRVAAYGAKLTREDALRMLPALALMPELHYRN